MKNGAMPEISGLLMGSAALIFLVRIERREDRHPPGQQAPRKNTRAVRTDYFVARASRMLHKRPANIERHAHERRQNDCRSFHRRLLPANRKAGCPSARECRSSASGSRE